MRDLPLGAEDKRLNKMYKMAEYCASFPDGCTETQMIVFAKGFGNIVPTIMRMLADMGESGIGLVSQVGNRYIVTNTNYITWGETRGFRERVYNIKCPGCDVYYGSTNPTCPQCGAINPLNLNEPKSDTHIQPETETTPKAPSLTTEPYTYTHENEGTLRQERVNKGKNAEKKAVTFLSRFGEASLGKGRDGEPDVLFISSIASYAVEVKSVDHQVKNGAGYKVASVPLSVGQWSRLRLLSESNGLIPLLLVEVRVRGSSRGSTYYFVPREVVDACISKSKGKHIRFSVHDLPAMSVQTIREGLPVLGGFRL